MIEGLVNFIANCPALRHFSGGVNVDYTGGSYTSVALKGDPTLKIVHRYENGDCLVQRTYKAEVYFPFSGDTAERCAWHGLLETLQDYLYGRTDYSAVGKRVVNILPANGGNTIKSGVGEGVLTFKFSVLYLQQLKGAAYAQYRI